MEWDLKRGIDPETGITISIPKKVSEDTIIVGKTVVASTALYLHLFFLERKILWEHQEPSTISTSRNPTKVLRCSGWESSLQSSITSLMRARASSIVFPKVWQPLNWGQDTMKTPILIGLDNDGNRDRFRVQIIGIPA